MRVVPHVCSTLFLNFTSLPWDSLVLCEKNLAECEAGSLVLRAPAYGSLLSFPLVSFSRPLLTPLGLLLWFVYLQVAFILGWPFWPLASLTQRSGHLVRLGGSKVPNNFSSQVAILGLGTLQEVQRVGVTKVAS